MDRLCRYPAGWLRVWPDGLQGLAVPHNEWLWDDRDWQVPDLDQAIEQIRNAVISPDYKGSADGANELRAALLDLFTEARDRGQTITIRCD